MAAPATFVVVSQEQAGPSDAYKSVFKKVGISQLVFGVTSIGVGIVCFALWITLVSLITYAPSIYSGVWFCISGGLALSASSRPTSCNVTGGMVIAILSLFGCGGMIYYEILLARLISAAAGGFHFLVILHIILVLCAFGQLVSAIINIVYASKANKSY